NGTRLPPRALWRSKRGVLFSGKETSGALIFEGARTIRAQECGVKSRAGRGTAIIRARVNETKQNDVDLLVAARPRRALAAGEEILDGEGSSRDVLLLLSGAATVAAETPFGPHPVATMKAPS